MKRLGIYHSKDMDGYVSGAVLKHKFPDIELVGWDYADELIPISKLMKYEHVIMIDITFPIEYMTEVSEHVELTVIDHHISFKKQVDKLKKVPFNYFYDNTISACELGWKHYFGGTVPPCIELVGRYDTWRDYGSSMWNKKVVPFKLYSYSKVSGPNDVPTYHWFDTSYDPTEEINEGKIIQRYVKSVNKSIAGQQSFVVNNAYGKYKALCINTNLFSSDMFEGIDTKGIDIFVGFTYNKGKWSISLRNNSNDIDVSEIAFHRGGGGHKGAAGFQSHNFQNIFL